MKSYSSATALRADFATHWGSYEAMPGVKEPSIEIRHTTDKVYRDYTGRSGPEYTNTWASYKLDQLPGCCGVVVSNGAFIDKDQRGVGLGTFFHNERIELSKYLGYSCMMATTTNNNLTEQHILKSSGWNNVHSFTNRRTGNRVQIWIKDI